MKQKDILIILVSSFVLVIAWVGFSIYHSSVKSTIPETLNIKIIPIEPNFDVNTIEKIKNRKEITPIFEMTPEEKSSESAI